MTVDHPRGTPPSPGSLEVRRDPREPTKGTYTPPPVYPSWPRSGYVAPMEDHLTKKKSDKSVDKALRESKLLDDHAYMRNIISDEVPTIRRLADLLNKISECPIEHDFDMYAVTVIEDLASAILASAKLANRAKFCIDRNITAASAAIDDFQRNAVAARRSAYDGVNELFDKIDPRGDEKKDEV